MKKELSSKQFATRAIHSGLVPDDPTRSVTTAIYPSSTYRVEFPGDESGYVYSRWSNPTRLALEETLATIESGTRGLAFSSGLAAMHSVLMLLKPGDQVVAVSDLYGGSRRLFERAMRPFGLDFVYVDPRDTGNFLKATTPATKLFWVETPTNPLLYQVDIAALAAEARKRGILLAVDNTFASPYLQRPLELGADIVHHSASKYLGGHCDVIAGVLVSKDQELGEKLFFNQYAIGGVLSPFDSWLVMRGLKTLHLRMERHSQNALALATYLSGVDLVKQVMYPGLPGQPLLNGMKAGSGMISFTLDADFETVKTFCTSTDVFILAESLGGVESLINHPAAMTHASIPKDVREANGIGDNLVRLSVGVEDVGDLLGDLKQAFAKIAPAVVKR